MSRLYIRWITRQTCTLEAPIVKVSQDKKKATTHRYLWFSMCIMRVKVYTVLRIQNCILIHFPSLCSLSIWQKYFNVHKYLMMPILSAFWSIGSIARSDDRDLSVVLAREDRPSMEGCAWNAAREMSYMAEHDSHFHYPSLLELDSIAGSKTLYGRRRRTKRSCVQLKNEIDSCTYTPLRLRYTANLIAFRFRSAVVRVVKDINAARSNFRYLCNTNKDAP